VKVTHAEEMPFVSMDMVFMDQVLINLLDNALKNTPDMIWNGFSISSAGCPFRKVCGEQV
jgi:K+-sensing histidine kinase KdpD